MNVRFKTIAAGPHFFAKPGDVKNVSLDDAKEFVRGGYADAIDPSELLPKQPEDTGKKGKK